MLVCQFRHIPAAAALYHRHFCGSKNENSRASRMYLGANGLVINELGHVLLIQRDDSRSWGLPGGGLDEGETPTEAVTREVE
ncbi:MAG: NUDIX domain-containing protein, partial [Anaerolineales bacterium]|nr:NUDIX domain-containing protein [Anaerolineales bacterium]